MSSIGKDIAHTSIPIRPKRVERAPAQVDAHTETPEKSEQLPFDRNRDMPDIDLTFENERWTPCS